MSMNKRRHQQSNLQLGTIFIALAMLVVFTGVSYGALWVVIEILKDIVGALK